MNKLQSIYASAYSASMTIVVVVAMTIGAELSVSFKNWLAGFTGHHWTTKSLSSLIIFVLFYCLLRYSKKSVSPEQTKKAMWVLEIFTIIGFLAILGFYMYEFLGH